MSFKRIPTEAERAKLESAFPTKYNVKPKKKAGRPKGAKSGTKHGAPKYVPTDEERLDVMMMSANGIKPTAQAQSLGIPLKILNQFFKNEMDYGKMQANTKVSGALYNKAMDGNVPAMIFWLKSQAGWREADRLEVTGANGKNLVNLTETDKEQRMLSVLMKAKGLKPTKDADPVKVLFGPDSPAPEESVEE